MLRFSNDLLFYLRPDGSLYILQRLLVARGELLPAPALSGLMPAPALSELIPVLARSVLMPAPACLEGR